MLRYRLRPGTPSINTAVRGIGLMGEVAKYLFARKGALSAPPALSRGLSAARRYSTSRTYRSIW